MTRPTTVRRVPGYAAPVIDERAVRVSAGFLFVFGAVALTAALITGSLQPLQPFGLFFLLDMLLRITAGDRWSPTLAVARALLSRQSPQ